MAIKWVHRILTVFLLIIVIIGCLIWRSDTAPYNDSLYSKKELSNGLWLYITKHNNPSATDTDVYRYYLNKKLDSPLAALQETAPFLTADTSEATVSAIGQHVMVKLTGKVYSFSNSAFFYNDSTPMMPRIDLNFYAVNE
ncbi:hypothetical protein [Serratia sp. UGAL515B_01]|uniref:hypothetical protein n=1 Tax=Serratia sp. UGAL515B_01 TaxID=2986763 RepID=UPI002954E63C|nr:hypothetical protein [Serratia sp. UGAL515B_01]WON77705.1 hypothetical protein OK023_03110 [Serratia sp. UGAL515B_01]